MLYAAYGLTIDSDREIPELDGAPTAAPDVRLRWDAAARPLARTEWSTLWRLENGDPWVSVARTPRERYLRFARYMSVSVTGGETGEIREIDVARRGHAQGSTVRHLFLDQALPLVLAGAGELVLHASAVHVQGRAVLLAGPAGAGKSTLAAQLSRTGADVLADDGVLVRQIDGALHAWPSYPGLRLFDDSSAAAGLDAAHAADVAEYTTKRRFTAPGAAVRGPVPLGRIYVLDGASREMVFERLSRRDGAMAVLHHAYRADVSDAAAVRTQFDLVGRWAGGFDVWRISFPRSLASAAAVAEAVAAHAGTVASGCR